MLNKFLITSISFLLPLYLAAQIPGDPCFKGSSIKLVKGQNYTVSCDSVFLLNPLEYNLYKKSKAFLLKTPILKDFNNLEALYQETFQQDRDYQNQLKAKFESLSADYLKTINNSQVILTQVSQQLENAQKSLIETDNNLKEVTKILKSERKRDAYSKILWGTAGIGLGFIAAAFLLH